MWRWLREEMAGILGEAWGALGESNGVWVEEAMLDNERLWSGDGWIRCCERRVPEILLVAGQIGKEQVNARLTGSTGYRNVRLKVKHEYEISKGLTNQSNDKKALGKIISRDLPCILESQV